MLGCVGLRLGYEGFTVGGFFHRSSRLLIVLAGASDPPVSSPPQAFKCNKRSLHSAILCSFVAMEW